MTLHDARSIVEVESSFQTSRLGFEVSHSLKQPMGELSEAVDELLRICRNRGIEMRVKATLRHPIEQGRLWRQSRSDQTVKATVRDLRSRELDYLADCIASAPAMEGPLVTYAIPGYSWHQWGEAVDCTWIVDGEPQRSPGRLVNGHNGYEVYTQEAARLGLTPGGCWERLADWPHVQMRPHSSPLSRYTADEINAVMRENFS